MTAVTAPLRRAPRTLRTPSAVTPARVRRTLSYIRRVSEGMNSNDRARLCDVTLQPYTEARFQR